MRITDGDRSAAMQLGISTVVILVIAMVMIGAGISFIRTIFSSGEQVVMESVPSEDLTLNPTSESPFKLSRTSIQGGSGESASFQVGIYNSDTSSQEINLTYGPCKAPNSDASEDDIEDAFGFASTTRNVSASSSATYRVIMTLPGSDSAANLNPVDDSPYLCRIKAEASGSDSEFVKSRDVTINIVG